MRSLPCGRLDVPGNARRIIAGGECGGMRPTKTHNFVQAFWPAIQGQPVVRTAGILACTLRYARETPFGPSGHKWSARASVSCPSRTPQSCDGGASMLQAGAPMARRVCRASRGIAETVSPPSQPHPRRSVFDKSRCGRTRSDNACGGDAYNPKDGSSRFDAPVGVGSCRLRGKSALLFEPLPSLWYM